MIDDFVCPRCGGRLDNADEGMELKPLPSIRWRSVNPERVETHNGSAASLCCRLRDSAIGDAEGDAIEFASLCLSVPEPKDRQPGLDGIAVFAAIPTLVVDLSSLDLLHPTV
jgi:hypothetical protein